MATPLAESAEDFVVDDVEYVTEEKWRADHTVPARLQRVLDISSFNILTGRLT